jgi:UDP-N-acetylglucosamine:LPS N-acetylglucosamine transferase
MMSHKLESKPLVGFFPLFYNLAETGRAVLIAKRYVELGGKVVFFSHGGKFEYLAKDQGFEIVRVKPIYTPELVNKIVRINRGEEKGIAYSLSFLQEAVSEEISAFEKTGVNLVVSFVNIPSSISARAAKIPLVCISPAPGNFHKKIPDNFENYLTKLIPQFIKVPLLNFFFTRSKKFLKPFNILAKKYGINTFKTTMDVVWGDLTLATNFLEFINIFPNQQMFPKENYIGIITLEELFTDRFSKEDAKKIEDKINLHLNNDNRSILLTMGSSGDKQLYLSLLKALNKTNYRVVAVYANILTESELPTLNDNILLLKFVPSLDTIHKKVDISIIHGGQGTVYAAAYAGKPMIGFPMQFEQHLNLEKLVGHGTAKMLSKKFFNENRFLKTIENVFDNYEIYLSNAKRLANLLPKPQGDINAAKKIMKLANTSIDKSN